MNSKYKSYVISALVARLALLEIVFSSTALFAISSMLVTFFARKTTAVLVAESSAMTFVTTRLEGDSW